jgi:hypothetical protein
MIRGRIFVGREKFIQYEHQMLDELAKEGQNP